MPQRRHRYRSGVFIVNFGHISHLVLVFPLLTLSWQMPAEIGFTMISEGAEVNYLPKFP